jgi:hypothetical protein
MVRPYHPLRELEGHLDRGELDSAIALARGLANERRRPLELEVTVRFLPLVATQRPEAFDIWSLRWLERWCAERRERATIEDAGELAAALAELAVDPERALQTVAALHARLERAAKSRAVRR